MPRSTFLGGGDAPGGVALRPRCMRCLRSRTTGCLFFPPPFYARAPLRRVPVVPHVGWSNLYLEELLPKFSIPPVDVRSFQRPIKAPGEKMSTTPSTTGASAWKCHRCNHANDTVRNKKRCSSCRSWKDGIAPLSASARCVVLDNKAGIDIFEDARENDSPNTKNASFRMVGTTSGHERTGERRESPLQSIDGRSPLSPILAPPSPARRPTHQYVTPNVWPLQCSGVYEGSFGPAFTFAAKSLQYTADQLRRWAREPDFGLKSFAGSILSASRSLCLPYQGVILDRAHNPCDGFVFRAVSCTGSCSTTEKRKHCEHCASKINVARKVRIDPKNI